jgi:hypothetical protein
MFDRYNIIDEQDRAAAVAKRFANLNGKHLGNIETAVDPTPPLSSTPV